MSVSKKELIKQENSDLRKLKLPRVLVCTAYPFNSHTGGGITLRSLFEGWPKTHLAQIYGMGHSPDLDICENNFFLNETTAQSTSTSILSRLIRFASFIRGQNELGLIWAQVTRGLQKFVTDFEPDIIFTQLGTLTQIQLALQLSKFAQVPLAVHIADDWANGFYQRNDPVSRYLHYRLERDLRRALDVTAVRWGMSMPMARAYEKRYGGQWGYIYNPIFVERWPERSEPKAASGKFRLLYSGSIIGNAQKRSLLEICEAVALLGAEGMKIELNIYTFSHYLNQQAELERLPFVRVHEQVPFEQLPEHLGSADLLVLPVNFDDESVNYIRYSMPGKVSEYLMSGTPTLVYGPADVVPVEYALREGWGHVVTEQGAEGLMRAIRELAASGERREELARRAREVGLRNHNAEEIRARFRQDIAEAAKPSTEFQRGSDPQKCEARSFA
jgi:glycosyltransferase involved in cell wall biosynthesis